ncbi:hypothetical protein KSW90_14600 [Prevotella copri]|uniref:hypothetical protein n=1 Tax=Segatella copri TaxID=165179 RepID=UPI001C38533E|nr:hypothetical protein [Segatella copri]MBV3445274.1 hypothetical protein [Segatella copri]
MYEEVSRAPNHFSVVLFLRRCKSTAKTEAKQSLSHNSPEKPTFLGKIGHFLGKIKNLHAQQEKTRKKRIILTKRQGNTLIFRQAFPHTFPDKLLYLGIIGAFLGKIEALLGKIPCFLGKW